MRNMEIIKFQDTLKSCCDSEKKANYLTPYILNNWVFLVKAQLKFHNFSISKLFRLLFEQTVIHQAVNRLFILVSSICQSTKDVGNFLLSWCLYPNNICNMSGISPEPYFLSWEFYLPVMEYFIAPSIVWYAIAIRHDC